MKQMNTKAKRTKCIFMFTRDNPYNITLDYKRSSITFYLLILQIRKLMTKDNEAICFKSHNT